MRFRVESLDPPLNDAKPESSMYISLVERLSDPELGDHWLAAVESPFISTCCGQGELVARVIVKSRSTSHEVGKDSMLPLNVLLPPVSDSPIDLRECRFVSMGMAYEESE
jgi:hypothetical protein